MSTEKSESKKSETTSKSIFKKIPVWAWAVCAVVVVVVGVCAVALSTDKPAATTGDPNAQLYLTGPSETHTGETFTVSLKLNPPKAVDGVETTINYDASQLQFVSVDSAGSAFPVKLQEENSAGTLQIVRGIFAPNTINSDSLVSDIKFKALKATGDSELHVAGKASSGGSYLPALSTSGLTVKIR